MSQRSHTVLVVDDDLDARLLMKAALRKAGFEVRLAEGGQDGLRQFRAAPCDLVMLDMDMPDLDGREVCTLLRAEAGPLLPIVMVTGMDDLGSVKSAYESGATDFITKPVHWALIGHRVRYLLRSHQALLDLRAAEARNAAILAAIPDLLFELDLDGRYVDFHAPRADLLAAPPGTLIGRTVHDLLPPAAAQACMAALRSALAHGSSTGQQFELPLAQGSTWFELSVSRKSVPEGQTPRFIVLSRDITERKLAEARIARMAYFDSLTGLPNRVSFLERVDREIRRAARNGRQLALLFMDLDGFKDINDTKGHAAGDLVLQWAAERLHEGLRPTDLVSRPMGDGSADDGRVELARLGGDEFTALILDIDGAAEALAVAHRVGQMMRRPFVLEGGEITLTASIGISLYPEDGADAATLLTHADTAMYHAKSSGRDNAKLYSISLTQEIQQRIEVEASLRVALERDQFHLVYQPQIDVTAGRVHSVEALLRWNHPTHGAMGPARFIPLAEENGLIGLIGLWVLRQACHDAARWNREGHEVGVAVNLSPVQLRSSALARSVADELARSGLAPHLLELEITEGALMENSMQAHGTLQALRALGVSIALDDFGTGYSSLAYLTRMPIQHLKIDRSFVKGLLEGGENEAIIRAVLAMSGSLGLQVTAEGVETAAQARLLETLACHRLQGYHFSRPVEAGLVPGLLARRWGPAREEGAAAIAVAR